ncbi:hypothetical protein C8Q80DRAFT_1187442 [Daedaleopsis nitida]|nr:hypothetical protein C8Q80DRAFT_1187442 [Daedaleopsis nitida]
MNRYTQIVAYASAVALIFPVDDHVSTCISLGWFESIVTMLPYIAWALFAGLRVYALSGQNTVFAILVALLNAAFIMPDVYEDAHAQSVNSPPPYGCYQSIVATSVSEGLLWASRAALLLGESIVLLWTLMATRSTRGYPNRSDRSRTLAEVLLNNGIACFVLPLVLNAVVLALDLKNTTLTLSVGQSIVVFRDALTTILVSRFLLQLGALSDRGDNLLECS